MVQAEQDGSQALARTPSEFAQRTEPHRGELIGYCYRMLGSLSDAEDLVQETFLRAWRKRDTFEGRASFRTWLYRIATNLCLNALERRPRRTLPPARPGAAPNAGIDEPLAEPIWLEPFPDEWFGLVDAGPEAIYSQRESISLAFLVLIQTLPARQRAVLILRDVLDWPVADVARTLDLSLGAVNSALYRARLALAKVSLSSHAEEQVHASIRADFAQQALLERYVRAWESSDVALLVELLREDAVLSMPPFPAWFQGRPAITDILARMAFAGAPADRWRLRPTLANGQPAFAMYHQDESGQGYQAYAVQVLTVDEEGIAQITVFLDRALVPKFGFPATLNVSGTRLDP